MTLRWRPEIDALELSVQGHRAFCLIHRLAFRALTTDATPEACLAFAAANETALLAAAHAKIARDGIPAGRNLHINSRDIRRQLTEG